MRLSADIRPVWERLRSAFLDLEERDSPVPKLGGSALPRWFERIDGPIRIALRPTPAALEIWAGEIEDDSTCVLERTPSDESSGAQLGRALGEAHPLALRFSIRFLTPDPRRCWPARPLLQGTRALGSLARSARTLDLYPAGLGVTLDWSAATPEAVGAAMAACADFVRAVGAEPDGLDTFAEAQALLEAAEDDAGAAEASPDAFRGYRPRFTRGLMGTLPPLGLKWILGIGAAAACFSALAALGKLFPRWGIRVETDSGALSAVFAGLFAVAAYLAWRTLGRHRAGRKDLPWNQDHPWPRQGPLVEDWARDAGLRASVAAPSLALGLFIMSPAALEESEAACINVGLGLGAVVGGLYQAVRLATNLGRIVLRGPARLWLEPYPLRPGAEFDFRVHIPGRRGLPVLHATLRSYRPRMVESEGEHRLKPVQHCLRSVPLQGPDIREPGSFLRGHLAIPAGAQPSAHTGCPGTYWELTVHGPKARRFPDLCFLIPVYLGSVRPKGG